MATGIYKDNGSRFLSFAYPVTDEEQAKELIKKLKGEYFDARHHCYAYRIGYTGGIWRINDDGEPSSTAGRPIYGQILANSLSDILVVVVRYFGGIKLGVPGLIKAYKSATADAIEHCTVIEKIATRPFEVTFEYLQMNGVMKILKEFQIQPYNQKFNLNCSLAIDIRLTLVEKVCESLEKIEGTKISEICQKV